VQHGCSFRVFTKIFKVFFGWKSYQMYLIREIRRALDKGRSIRAYAEQQLASVTTDQRYGNLLESLECALLAGVDINKLGNVDHWAYHFYKFNC